MLDNDSKIILETMERTRQMIKEDTQEVKKSFMDELGEDLKRTEPDWFFKVLFLLLLSFSITGHLSVPLYVFAILYLIPTIISVLTVSIKKFSEFIDRKLFEKALKLEKEYLKSNLPSTNSKHPMPSVKSPKEELLEDFEENYCCGCCQNLEFKD